MKQIKRIKKIKRIRTIKGLASIIAKKEGKKSQVRIGDIREILSILSDMVFSSAGCEMIA